MSNFDQEALKNFRTYLQIPSVQPNVNYDACVSFLTVQAKCLNLPIKIHEIVKNKPIVIITWEGKEPKFPSIFLYNHMDVVPVFENKWTQKPFDAEIVDNKIYARGAQDMKCLGITQFEVIRRLKYQKIQLKRTIHLCFMPDEEIGGDDGMAKFVSTEEFKNLNIGFAFDEGMANSTEEFLIFNGEKCVWQLNIHCPGNPGHGSLLLDNTAGEKLTYILKKFDKFRDEQKQKLQDNFEWTIGDVTSINLTKIEGGVQTNVIPPEFIATFDCRLPPKGVDLVKWEEMLNQWCEEAGSDVWIEYQSKDPQVTPTKVDNSNIYWTAFKQATDKLGLKVRTIICPACTDGRFLRQKGIPVLGFSPINFTPVLAHDHDEFLPVDVFLKGIEIYKNILISVANV